MAGRTANAAPVLPPKSAGQCWAEFLKWAIGVPLVCAGGLAVIAGALWLAGGQALMWQATSDMGTALFWIAAIVLMYPLLLWFWIEDLRSGLRAARDWQAMTPEAQAAALEAAKAVVPQPRRRRRKGQGDE
jgi:hypothetical protein